MKKVFTVKVAYSSVAEFDDFNDAINFLSYAIMGGLKDIEISQKVVEDEEVEA